jgi:hypothetical protein
VGLGHLLNFLATLKEMDERLVRVEKQVSALNEARPRQK